MIITTPDNPTPESYPGGHAFGATLRGRRMQACMTLRLCAELMEMSMTDLSAIEQGKRRMSGDERERFECVIKSRTDTRLRDVRYYPVKINPAPLDAGQGARDTTTAANAARED